ncbi:hypothetical protein I3679_017345 [Proteus mirabilis]|uniref:Uncharacterized protein n=1 Tax=Proteus mirabilis TaxID=584 RepID=A0ABD5LUE4_PROMI
MDRKEFEIIFKLNKKQPWLAEKYSELISLLFNDCKCENERKLLIELLDRFTYLCESDFNDALNKLSDYLVGESGLNAATTQIVSLTADSYSDSGQSILYALKVDLKGVIGGNTLLLIDLVHPTKNLIGLGKGIQTLFLLTSI